MAELVTVRVVSSLTVLAAGACRKAGTLFTSLTTTVKVLVALRGSEPLSATMLVNVLVLGPCASVGVQVITPLAEMLALVTGPAAEVTDKV